MLGVLSAFRDPHPSKGCKAQPRAACPPPPAFPGAGGTGSSRGFCTQGWGSESAGLAPGCPRLPPCRARLPFLPAAMNYLCGRGSRMRLRRAAACGWDGASCPRCLLACSGRELPAGWVAALPHAGPRGLPLIACLEIATSLGGTAPLPAAWPPVSAGGHWAAEPFRSLFGPSTLLTGGFVTVVLGTNPAVLGLRAGQAGSGLAGAVL